MKFILAPDSFKGSLTAVQAADRLQIAAKRHFPDAEIIKVPIADGGEGTLDALLCCMGGKKRQVTATGPLGEKVRAFYGVLADGTAVVEMAQASGLPLCKGRLDPLAASSRGAGEVLLKALRGGASQVLMGIGGSAANDGGMGFLSALGARFWSADGHLAGEGGGALGTVVSADFTGISPLLKNARINVLCDVNNPLLGKEGATAVYGPQKGVKEALFPALEAGMARYAGVLAAALGRDVSGLPGAGAAGGMGAALYAVGAVMESGIDGLLRRTDFRGKLSGASLVVTGEGRLDTQSVRYGKAISGIAQACRDAGVPLAVLAGSMGAGAEELYTQTFSAVMTCVNAPMTLSDAMANADVLYCSAADRLFRFLAMGMRMCDACRSEL
jgi:glycerate 2-kinase